METLEFLFFLCQKCDSGGIYFVIFGEGVGRRLRINGIWTLCNVRKSFLKKRNAILFICLISGFARFVQNLFVCLFVFIWGFFFFFLREKCLKEDFRFFIFTLKLDFFFPQHTFVIATIHMIWCNYYLLGKLEPET